MYSRREKLSHYNTLRGGNHAEADFRLLKEKSPSHPMLGIMARNPNRYEDDILFALLDVCSIEEILQSRHADVPSNQTNNGSSKALTNGPGKKVNASKGSSKASNKASSKASSKGKGSGKSSSKTPSKSANKNNGSSKTLTKDEPSSKTLTSEAHDENIDHSSDVDELSEAADTSDTSTESKKK